MSKTLNRRAAITGALATLAAGAALPLAAAMVPDPVMVTAKNLARLPELDPDAEMVALGTRYAAAHAAWLAALDLGPAEGGRAVLERDRLAAAILAHPVASPRGLAIKAVVLQHELGPDLDLPDAPGTSGHATAREAVALADFVADVLRLAEHPQVPVVSLGSVAQRHAEGWVWSCSDPERRHEVSAYREARAGAAPDHTVAFMGLLSSGRQKLSGATLASPGADGDRVALAWAQLVDALRLEGWAGRGPLELVQRERFGRFVVLDTAGSGCRQRRAAVDA